MALQGSQEVRAKRRPVGRPRTDLGLKLRNQIWSFLVWRLSGMTWDKLDEAYLTQPEDTDKNRRRAFWGIYRLGHNPRSTSRKDQGVDLVDEVAHTPALTETKQAYESLFWDILSSQGLSEERLGELNNKLLEMLDLYQAAGTELEAGKAVLPKDDAFRLESSSARQQGIARLVAHPTLDSLALLSVQFRIAMSSVFLEEAREYLDGLRLSLKKLIDRWTLFSPLAGQLELLVEARLVRNRWDHPILQSLKRRDRSKRKPSANGKNVQSMLNDWVLQGTKEGGAPIVRRTAAHKWIHENHEAVMHDLMIKTITSQLASSEFRAMLGLDKKIDQQNFLKKLRDERRPAPYDELNIATGVSGSKKRKP